MMMEFTYTLTGKEYAEYYQYFVMGDKKVRSSRRNFIYFIPIIILAGLYVLNVRMWYVYLIILLLSPLWFILANYIYNSIVIGQMIRTLKIKQADKFTELQVVIKPKKLISVTACEESKELKLLNYSFSRNLLVLQCDDNEVVLLPIRLFDTEERLKEILKLIEN
jgi:hypothetical protein